jgi:hypothetical protein
MATAKNSSKHGDKANTLQVVCSEADSGKVLAQTALRPTVQAAITLQQWSKKFGELDLSHLVEELRTQATFANDGKLARGEAMLMTQAHTLDAIFNELARRAALNMGEYLNACETYLRLALKAQSQCRATLETLALMKNPPPTTFVRQANIANNQQVNNGTPVAAEASRARETEIQPNKLLERVDGERLDSGASATAVGTDPQLATVGTINGAAYT